MDLIFDLLILAFFGPGELLVCHSEICRLVSGSYSKIHDSSPVMSCLKKKNLVFFDAFEKVQLQIHSVFLLFVGEDFRDQLCTNFPYAQFLGSKFRGQFGDSNSTHYRPFWLSNVNQTSLEPSIWSHFTPLFDVQGLSERVSCCILSRPSKNTLCHLEPRALWCMMLAISPF